MTPEPPQNVTASSPAKSTSVTETPSDNKHPVPPVTGVVPPQLGEALIREVRPSVVEGSGAISGLAQKLICSIILAPLGWMLLAPLFLRKLMLPFLPKRYTLTNKRLMIRRGLKPREVESIALADIDEVRLYPDSYNAFYRCGTLEIVSRGEVRMRLPGVPAPEVFRVAIINACGAWVPGKIKNFQPFIPASSSK